ncbi:arginine/ornithine transport system substrate-binding protein [Inhella inkyongensis]|uniref:Arginine/ornithine transport system substrate-binding protein n=1 Tax=Inhella inkyongensis TaxID=392593 RepID=A0A840S521_9BURK|nr:transporter substrate-binding domain-containing protein [Inhella inkyongensis]MBB5203914.1 arginine/ornithine transport system substrate-binding protein [Inhella inkyongensis]
MSVLSRRCLLAALLLGAGLAQVSSHAQTPKKLRIGVEGAYPPFSEVGPDGQIKGFEIDLARQWCAHMKRECELVKTDFDGLIPALQARKIDAIVASLSITPERKKAIAFSRPYYSTPQTFLAKAGTPADISPAALKGKKIGVQSATINEAYVNALYSSSVITRYATQDQAYLELKTGRIDYSLVDKSAALAFTQSPAGQGISTVGPELRDRRYFGDGVGVGVRKADAAQLGAAFSAAIAAGQADGSFKALAAKYFPYDISPP